MDDLTKKIGELYAAGKIEEANKLVDKLAEVKMKEELSKKETELREKYEKEKKKKQYKRGVEAEQKFKELLNGAHIPYVYFEQSPFTFSPFFKDIMLKRPDFLIVFRTGIVGLDVKSKRVDREKYSSPAIPLDETDIEKLNNFERYFKIPVWYAITIEGDNYKKWYLCNLNQLIKSEIKKSQADNRYLRLIPFEDCIKIDINEEINLKQLLI